ncbi:hypothetical protein CXB51_034679 [Gossypium anomalum]|uniref:DUF4283 domain-containing protein n=1 Tax=Gossypium anomalum TaxID=47600 RepID=A0A8J5Y1G0_9ROSI|nr:hypothetical protein CXB51_034679 [Gossypium anomalum]
MENELADLSLDDVKDEVLLVQRDTGSQVVKNNFILVGCFLTASIVHSSAMKSTMANLWHLVRGVQISDLGDKQFRFKFFHKMDLDRVLNGLPWTFNNHLLGTFWGSFWNMILKALVEARATAMCSVWFIEDNDGRGFGSNSRQSNLGSGTQEKVWQDLGVRLDPMLGLNLEGGNSSLGQVRGLVDMEHDAEELLIAGRCDSGYRGKTSGESPFYINGCQEASRPGTMKILYWNVYGGLSLAWKDNTTVTLRSYSIHHIDVDIQESKSTLQWCFTGFYEASYAQGMEDTWRLLNS